MTGAAETDTVRPDILRPDTVEALTEVVQWAVSSEVALEVRGSGSKRALGRDAPADAVLDTSAFTGIREYTPSELVLTAGAGTPLAEIDAALDEAGQQLAFEPFDPAALLGGGNENDSTLSGTLGGLVACGLSGPRRVMSGAVRDHVLGFEAVSGRGEVFKSGGRVMKNVTGFDLSKLLTGSFGTLAVMTQVTLKVLPRPEKTRTVLVLGLDDAMAVSAMRDAMNSPYEVSGACYLPSVAAARSAVEHVSGADTSVTAIRVEGPAPSVEARAASLHRLLGDWGTTEELHTVNSCAFWRETRDATWFARSRVGETQVWRVSVPPAEGAMAAAALRTAAGGESAGETVLDWGGGLVWLSMPARDDAAHAQVRAAFDSCGGHATLIRADAPVRRAVPVFQPQAGPHAELTRRIKNGFDPGRVLNRDRMYAGI